MTTHLVHASFSMRAFNRWAGERGLIRRGSFDEGYALHVLLSAMFGKAVLQPLPLVRVRASIVRFALRLCRRGWGCATRYSGRRGPRPTAST